MERSLRKPYAIIARISRSGNGTGGSKKNDQFTRNECTVSFFKKERVCNKQNNLVVIKELFLLSVFPKIIQF